MQSLRKKGHLPSTCKKKIVKDNVKQNFIAEEVESQIPMFRLYCNGNKPIKVKCKIEILMSYLRLTLTAAISVIPKSIRDKYFSKFKL